MRDAPRFLAAALLAVLAILLALLAADVRAWGDAVASGDTLYSASPSTASWRPTTRLPTGLSEWLVGAGDDVAARRALQRYRATANTRTRLDNAVEVAAARAATERALAAVARSGDPATAAQARTLLGILAFGDFARGGETASQAEAAISDFDSAVRIDPGNETAKYDLELALSALAARGVRVEPGSGSGTGSTGRRGARGGVPGHGY